MWSLHSILLVSTVAIFCVVCVLTSTSGEDLPNPNCGAHLKKIRKEHAELKSLKEKESDQAHNELVQLKNEMESLELSLNKLKENIVYTQQNLSLCTSTTFNLTSRLGVSREDKSVWENRLAAILNATQTIGNQIESFQQQSLDNSLFEAEISEFKLAHNVKTQKLKSEYKICQSALSSCVREKRNLNDSLAEMALNTLMLQAEISELKASHDDKEKALAKQHEICQTDLASCINGYQTLNFSLLNKKSSSVQCKILRTSSLKAGGHIISTVVDVQLSKNSIDWTNLIFNGSRFLTNSTWKTSGCDSDNSTLVANGWYDANCRMVWRYDSNATVDVKQNGSKHFKLKLVDQISAYPKDCAEITFSRKPGSGVYRIYPDGTNSIQVYCDMSTDGGGWTVVLQRNKRGTQREDFYRNWIQHENGFGDVLGGDYNIGLINLLALTSSHDQQLRVDLSDLQGNSAYANYKTFWIGGADEKYELTVGKFSGNAGDSLTYHNGHRFSTFDQDNGAHRRNYAAIYGGAWWYQGNHYSNLNGKFSNVEMTDEKGIIWYNWKNKFVSLKSAEMKIRPTNFDTTLKSLV